MVQKKIFRCHLAVGGQQGQGLGLHFTAICHDVAGNTATLAKFEVAFGTLATFRNLAPSAASLLTPKCFCRGPPGTTPTPTHIHIPQGGRGGTPMQGGARDGTHVHEQGGGGGEALDHISKYRYIGISIYRYIDLSIYRYIDISI